ncbi:hypothetical protein Taro_040064 [Colocasia esculenta]|uniref:Uncharacterized protein n=1 Tax=Colocasia esculenta TaxID=4460 RepID=A0A843WKP9_COLES|nr:hypothetical protein [Colocasia esculenta]
MESLDTAADLTQQEWQSCGHARGSARARGWGGCWRVFPYDIGERERENWVGKRLWQAHVALNDVDAAVESFKKALELEPNDGGIKKELAAAKKKVDCRAPGNVEIKELESYTHSLDPIFFCCGYKN